jgi:hypothetical protein
MRDVLVTIEGSINDASFRPEGEIFFSICHVEPQAKHLLRFFAVLRMTVWWRRFLPAVEMTPRYLMNTEYRPLNTNLSPFWICRINPKHLGLLAEETQFFQRQLHAALAGVAFERDEKLCRAGSGG